MTRPESKSHASHLPPALRRYWVWTLALAFISALYSMVMTHLTHSPHSYGLSLIWGSDRWWDFLIFHDRFVHFRTSLFWTLPTYPFTYPAPVAILFGLLYKLPHPLVTYLAACAIAALAWAIWLGAGLTAAGVARPAAFGFALTLVALAWPLWFQLVTANIEGVVVVILSFGVMACLRRHWYLGAILIAVAGALKIYPLILLGLLLSARRYREFATACIIAAAVTIASLAILGPSIPEAQTHITAGLVFVKDAFILSTAMRDTICNHSLFVPVKLTIARLHHYSTAYPPGTWAYLDEPARNNALLQLPYMIYLATASILALFAYLFRIRHLPLINQVLALMVCAVLLPPISIDYTLSNLFVPLGLLCLYTAATAGNLSAPRPSTLLFASFAIVMTIGTIFTVKYRLPGIVRTIALILLLIESMRQPLPWDQLNPPSSEASA